MNVYTFSNKAQKRYLNKFFKLELLLNNLIKEPSFIKEIEERGIYVAIKSGLYVDVAGFSIDLDFTHKDASDILKFIKQKLKIVSRTKDKEGFKYIVDSSIKRTVVYNNYSEQVMNKRIDVIIYTFKLKKV
jgi:hypothetical protein